MDDWTEPGAFEVVPGVFRVPLPLPNDGLRAVNVYVLVGDDRLTMIDAGWSIPGARDLLVKAIHGLGHAPSDIDRFLVTHVHRDHYTLAVALRREFGSRVLLGAAEQATLTHLLEPKRQPLEQQVEMLRTLGAEELANTMRAAMRDHKPGTNDVELPDEWLEPGTVEAAGRQLEVVATPGHTRGHLVFHDVGNAVFFAGDHVLPTITPSIGFEPVPAENPLGDFLASLALVRSRPDAKLLPAHGPVADSVHARVDELVAHHGARLDETEARVHAGATTAFEVACQLKWTRRGRTIDELDPFNQMLAVSETWAHLQLLVAQGRLRDETTEGVRRYTSG